VQDSDWVWRPTLASKGDDTPVDDRTLFPLSSTTFENIPVKIPANCDVHLTALYGDWRKLPPLDQQRPAHCRGADLRKPWKPTE